MQRMRRCSTPVVPELQFIFADVETCLRECAIHRLPALAAVCWIFGRRY